ncbi:MAG: hypothetical protein F4139_14190 [Gemmatimonadetes bacterium]|nr:hypothetical protein [Gemmatimonadota bacterium]MYH54069.1 hypothetical protein [Gemmatimonadota bacterium]MYK65374.1 hypothetical protein [Gemmatimonadota bacterium]
MKKLVKIGCLGAIAFFGLLIVIGLLMDAPGGSDGATAASCFSAWDGAHRTLEDRVEAQLKDPDSYEHVATRFSGTEEDPTRITLTFRAKNSFGAVVTSTATAQGGPGCSVSNVVIE